MPPPKDPVKYALWITQLSETHKKRWKEHPETRNGSEERKGKTFLEFYGEKKSTEIKEKKSRASIEMWKNPEYRAGQESRIPYNKGKTNEEFYGKERAKEINNHNSESKRGRTVPEEIVARRRGKKQSEATCDKRRKKLKGRSRPEDVKDRIKMNSRKKADAAGTGHNWRHNEWRDAIFKREPLLCKVCVKSGIELHAHHPKPADDYPESQYNQSNGELLCASCHKTVEVRIHSEQRRVLHELRTHLTDNNFAEFAQNLFIELERFCVNQSSLLHEEYKLKGKIVA